MKEETPQIPSVFIPTEDFKPQPSWYERLWLWLRNRLNIKNKG